MRTMSIQFNTINTNTDTVFGFVCPKNEVVIADYADFGYAFVNEKEDKDNRWRTQKTQYECNMKSFMGAGKEKSVPIFYIEDFCSTYIAIVKVFPDSSVGRADGC